MPEHYLKQELYDKVKSDSHIFDFIQNGSLDGIWYWNLENMQDEWMSPKLWEVLGYDPDEKQHLASEWQDLIFQEDLENALVNFNLHMENPAHPYDQVVRYRHKSGNTVWVRCRGIIIRDESGKPVRMLGAHTDVTELKETEENLRKKSTELERMNRIMVDREIRILELKRELNDVLKDKGQEPRYQFDADLT